MKKTTLFTLLALSITITKAQQQFEHLINANQLKQYMQVLCSDSLEGRETGTRGMQRTCNYLAAHYNSLGIAPYNESSYFQNYVLSVKKNGAQSYVKTRSKNYNLYTDFYFFPGFDDLDITTKNITFAGYGINDVKANYNNYASIDVKDKIVMILDGEPLLKDSIHLLTGTKEASTWTSNMRQKQAAARTAGVKLLLIVANDFANDIQSERLLHYLQKPTTTLKTVAANGKVPTLIISRKLAQKLIGKKQFAEVYNCFSGNKKCSENTAVFKTNTNIHIARETNDLQGKNVLGYIRGSEFPDEVVVMSAHLDHLGIVDGKTYYGADDDASGTSAVMILAKAFKAATDAGYRPKRSVLFLNFSGEEKGLLGSSYYAENPVFKFKQTVVDLNIDMIGRRDKKYADDPNFVYVIGSEKLSTELKTISEKANVAHTQLKLDYTYDDLNDPNQFYYRSDHYNFAKYDVPVIFYFNGVHEDYHKPTDTIDKIEFEKMQKITRLVYYTAWEVANAPQRIKVDKGSK
ncbi:MAG: M28 family peptidase [Bacteroidia bacterium]|nr:M28 family peptidase [Bacteroidia bacterium]